MKHWNCLVRKYGLYGITFPELLSLLIIFMYELLLLVCKIRLLCLFLLSLVILNHSGPIYIPVPYILRSTSLELSSALFYMKDFFTIGTLCLKIQVHDKFRIIMT